MSKPLTLPIVETSDRIVLDRLSESDPFSNNISRTSTSLSEKVYIHKIFEKKTGKMTRFKPSFLSNFSFKMSGKFRASNHSIVKLVLLEFSGPKKNLNHKFAIHMPYLMITRQAYFHREMNSDIYMYTNLNTFVH